MRIGLTTSVIQRGKTGIAQYVLALTREFACSSRGHEALKSLSSADVHRKSEPRDLGSYESGHEFTLFVLEEDLPLFEFAREKMNLVAVPEKFRTPLKNILWHQVHLPRLARRLGLDLLHVPSYRRMIWRRPCALVATVHDLAPFHLPGKYDWMRMFYGRKCARWLARRQDRIITISETTARDIYEFFGIPSDRISVIYNGIDHNRFHPGDPAEARREVVARYGLNRPYFIYVSRLEHPAKNHVRLIAAFNAFKAAAPSHWQLVFAGGDWHGAEEIHAAIAKSPEAKDIRALGFVPDADLPLLYRAAGACVYPSLYEGFGLPPVEAMACGCPVISSNRGSLGEVVGDAALQLDPENIEQWKAALARVSTDSALKERLRADGLEHARQFDWNKAAMATLAVYERTLDRAPVRVPCRIKVPSSKFEVQSSTSS